MTVLLICILVPATLAATAWCVVLGLAHGRTQRALSTPPKEPVFLTTAPRRARRAFTAKPLPKYVRLRVTEVQAQVEETKALPSGDELDVAVRDHAKFATVGSFALVGAKLGGGPIGLIIGAVIGVVFFIGSQFLKKL